MTVQEFRQLVPQVSMIGTIALELIFE